MSEEEIKTSKKRKNKDKKEKTKAKKLKPTEKDNELDEIREPTEEELAEVEKPENTVNIETIRKKKKKKHKKIVQEKKEASEKNEIERIIQYLENWKNNRSEWKFEKLRQIYIQKNVFIEDRLPTTLWPIALEYLSGTKGSSKNALIKSAEDLISKLDEDPDNVNNEINKIKYKRARDLLQILA